MSPQSPEVVWIGYGAWKLVCGQLEIQSRQWFHTLSLHRVVLFAACGRMSATTLSHELLNRL